MANLNNSLNNDFRRFREQQQRALQNSNRLREARRALDLQVQEQISSITDLDVTEEISNSSNLEQGTYWLDHTSLQQSARRYGYSLSSMGQYVNPITQVDVSRAMNTPYPPQLDISPELRNLQDYLRRNRILNLGTRGNNLNINLEEYSREGEIFVS